jgi:hypothetical protein
MRWTWFSIQEGTRDLIMTKNIKNINSTESLLEYWLTNGDYLRIAKASKYWALGLMKGIPADDLGQIVAMGLIVRSKRPGSSYDPSKGSVSNYIWLVAASSILSIVNKASMNQTGAELDLTKYDLERADDYQEFKDRIMDAESSEIDEKRMVIEEIRKALTEPTMVLTLSGQEIVWAHPDVADGVIRLLEGRPMKGLKMPVREEAAAWLKKYLKGE